MQTLIDEPMNDLPEKRVEKKDNSGLLTIVLIILIACAFALMAANNKKDNE